LFCRQVFTEQLFDVTIQRMNILEIAIEAEGGNKGGVTALAKKLELASPNVITNWRRRGLPHMATRAIKSMYAKQMSAAIKAEKAAQQQEPA
jgi:hypothetical protein